MTTENNQEPCVSNWLAEARRRGEEKLKSMNKKPNWDGIKFAEIGPYVPSEAEMEQLRQLAEMRNRPVKDDGVLF